MAATYGSPFAATLSVTMWTGWHRIGAIRTSPGFPDRAMAGRIETETERDGAIERESRLYLCSARLSAKMFARAVRGHWGIENR